MLDTVWVIVRNGKIELQEPLELPEGTQLLVTLLPDEGRQFWREASRPALARIRGNDEDDVYDQLLER